MGQNLPRKLSKYPQKQSNFLLAMLEAGIISIAAKTANISEATAHKWLNGGLSDVLEEMRLEMIESALNRIQVACSSAVETMLEILNDKSNPASIRLRASTTILDTTLKIREQQQIIDKLEALEERIDDDKS